MSSRPSAPPPVPAPGVREVAGEAADVLAAVAAAGWRAVLVPPTTTTAAFYAALAGGLELPAWFGANLDALWDGLADLPGPTALVLADWRTYAGAEPGHWRRLVELLEERADRRPPFAVLLVDDPPQSPPGVRTPDGPPPRPAP